MYIQRKIEDAILQLSASFKVLYVGGPRQVGKSTVLTHLAKKHGFSVISLDNPDIRFLAASDPGFFLQQHPAPLCIDEVQYVPELMSYIKLIVDASDKKGQYWLSGSQSFSLMKGIQESLAGRVGIVTLYGLSQAEEDAVMMGGQGFLPGRLQQGVAPAAVYTDGDIFSRIFRGSYPALTHDDAPSVDAFYSSYIQTYLDRDISSVFGVEKISEFHAVLKLVAARTGQLLNMSTLAKDAGVAVSTIKAWLSVLESSGIIFFLRPYFSNRSKRLVRSPKVYMTDTGMAAYLTAWRSSESLAHGAMAGALFETFVVMEIIKSYTHRGKEAPVWFYRDRRGAEVDVVIEEDGIVYPIEIKRGVRITDGDTAGLRHFSTSIPQADAGTVVCMVDVLHMLPSGIRVLPIGVIH